MRRLACALVLTVLIARPVHAQAPVITPPAEAEITHEEAAELDSYELPIASFADPVPTILLSGNVTRRAWRVSAAERTVASVAAGLRQAVEGQGYRRLLDCAGEDCGGFDFRFAASLIAPPAMAMNVRDFAQITAGRETPAAYASILVSQVRETIYVQVVTVVPGDPGLPLVAVPLDPLPETVPQVPEAPVVADGAGPEDEPEQTTDGAADRPRTRGGGGGATHADDVPDDGRPLLDRLLEYGHVPVAGLAFATGGSELTVDSAPALDEMARMLIANQDLEVAIVGHSDNVGPLNVNIELSRRRANAVRTALIDRGVRADRLEARGVGYLAPRRSNATEAGRALNRRVELVLR